MSSDENNFSHSIRSFIRRQGRITAAQKLALEQYSGKYCLDPAKKCDFSQVFGRVAPLCVEIGFGNGATLAQMARDNPDKDYIGIEVHRPGVGQLLMFLEQYELDNVRIYCHDALQMMASHFPDHCLSAVHLFFPDPWPKKKHHKRRIVRPEFIQLIVKKLKPGGYFHAATDWQPYAESMLEVLTASDGLQNTSTTNDYCSRPDGRPMTKFEQRGLRLGHGVWDLIFNKTEF